MSTSPHHTQKKRAPAISRAPPAIRTMASETIDDLLARYLGLLHEYTHLRSQLASHQASMYGHLARANFAAERGLRYGPDHFDGRMQALARLAVSADSEGGGGDAREQVPSFTVVRPKKEAKAEPAKDEEDDKPKQEDGESKVSKKDDDAAEAKQKKRGQTKEAKALRDPLQWFGVLTPMALRQAQHEAIEVIDSIVPQLASLSADMAAVEIEVRRARKKRARATASRGKEDKQASASTSTTTTAAAAESSSIAAVSI